MSKVLVVDDLPTELELICRTLQNVGLEVIRANDGEEAIGRINEEDADLIILDVVMPRMNGFEVIRELRESEKTKNIPIILCTQKDTEIDKTWGMELGADAYLTKPFDPQQLVNTVKRFL
ncbi:MAG TPA: response regulator [Nostocaceae cyanobacterium]|nr:response regulator [Nostocaceae cyanobacterium]